MNCRPAYRVTNKNNRKTEWERTRRFAYAAVKGANMSYDTKPRPRPKTEAEWRELRRRQYRNAGDNGGFRLLPAKLLDSDAFNELSKSSKLVLILSLRQIDYWHKKYKNVPKRQTSIGPLRNDGRFSLPSNLLKERGIKSSQTITEARKEIVSAGFWEVVETGVPRFFVRNVPSKNR
jgi:hypothetical protein